MKLLRLILKYKVQKARNCPLIENMTSKFNKTIDFFGENIKKDKSNINARYLRQLPYAFSRAKPRRKIYWQ